MARVIATCVVVLSIFAAVLNAGAASAGEVSVPVGARVDGTTDNATFGEAFFYNPNSTSVVLSLVVLELDSSTSASIGTLDSYVENGDGLQTVTIPALTGLTITAVDIFGQISDAGGLIQASWDDHVLSGDGSLRTITPIKAFLNLFDVHLDMMGDPDEFKSVGVSQIN